MMDEEECIRAINFLSLSADCSEDFKAIDVLEQLIDEYFNPQPYKFEELKVGMWVWEEDIGACMFVKEVNKNKINTITLTGGESFVLETVNITVGFKENCFYPITKSLEDK